MTDLIATLQAVAGNVETAVEPVGIDFDDTNDYLSRSSDLTGNTDSNTFTFSAWVYNVNGGFVYHVNPEPIASRTVYVNISSSSDLQFFAQNTSGSTTLFFTCADVIPENTFSHILISVDLSNTSNRYVYINDVDKTSSVVWSTYSNNNINFTQPGHGIGGDSLNASFDGRLAGVYLDYTYRDLSVEANRRDFIDADGLYVTPPTSGIISLPMDDPADPGRNDGTGGDFTLNGIVAQSGRGPNQYNAAASTFESADYVRAASLPNITSTGYTISVNVKTDLSSQSVPFVVEANSTNVQAQLTILTTGVLRFNAFDYNTSSTIMRITADEVLSAGRWYNIQAVIDPAVQANNKLYVDGVEVDVTFVTFVSRANHILSQNAQVGNATGSEISDVWFADTKVDLSSDNPFYDSETDKPKFLGASGELPTGSSPLIYLPLRAGDAGNNLGTGGDFTVNSGPYVGARGPSEHWEESVEFDGTGNNHLKLNTATISDSKEFTVFLAFKPDDSGTHDWFELSGYNGSSRFTVLKVFTTGTSGSVEISSQDSSDYSNRLRAVGSGTINTDEWNTLLISGSMTSSSTFKVYLNGSDVTDNKFNYDNENLEFSKLATQGDSSGLYIGRQPLGGNPADGGGAIYYIDNVYTDFSQEANRLKFLDAFNNPTDIAAKIDSEEIAQPLIYLPFDDKTNLGKNSGTIGDFTEVGTLTDDGYVNG